MEIPKINPALASLLFGTYGGQLYTQVQKDKDPLSIFTGTIPSDIIHSMKRGGKVKSKKPYLVGEDGPELFIPSKKGTIVPLKKGSSKSAVKARKQAIAIAFSEARGEK